MQAPLDALGGMTAPQLLLGSWAVSSFVLWLRLGQWAESAADREARKEALRHSPSSLVATEDAPAGPRLMRYTSDGEKDASQSASGRAVAAAGAGGADGGATRARKHSVADKIGKMTVNPFVNDTPRLGRYERLKCAVMWPVAVVRALVIAALLLVAAVASKVLLLGVPRARKGHEAKPLGPWRARLLSAAIAAVGRALLFVAGYYWIETTGRLVPAEEAPIIVPNHLSFIEPVYMATVCGAAAVSRKENEGLPLVGTSMRAIQCIFVDRRDSNSRHAVAAEIARRAAPGSGFPRLVLFPEGTCGNGKSVISFKAGAFGPGRPVQPIAVRLPYRHFDVSYVAAAPGGLALLARLLCQFRNRMTVDFLPVYHPSAEEKADAKLYARNVQKVIARKLDIPVTEHSYDDVQLQLRAQRIGRDPSKAVVEFNKLRKVLDVDRQTAEGLLQRFTELDVNGSGTVDYPTFVKAMGTEDTEAAGRLFELLDVDESGDLNFREYLIALSLINADSVQGRRHALRLAFTMLSSDGRITEEQLFKILVRAMPDTDRETASQLFAAADADKSGFIEVDEFCEWALRYEDKLPLFRQAYFGGMVTPQAAKEGAASGAAAEQKGVEPKKAK